MANFQVELPDGRKFTVEGAANAQAAAEGIQQMMAQQGGQQQPAAAQPQQDERSFPRAIADVGASFAGAVPKAAGAMVSIGSQVPVLNKVADPIAQSLMNAGEFVDDALLSDYQKNMNADMADAVAKSAIQLGPDATISDHIDNMKSQGGAAADFIMKNPSQALMLTSQALPYLVGGGIIGRGVAKLAPSTAGATAGAIGEGSIAAGAVTGDIIAQLEAEGIEGYTPDRLAALPAGVLTAVIGRMGAKVNQKLGGADVDTAIAGGGTGSATRGLSPKGAVIGGTTELGEEFLQSAQEQAFTNIGTGDPISDEVGSSAVQGAAAGFGMGSVIGSNVFNRDGSPRNPTDLQIAQRAAAADVARSLRKTAEDNEYNLGDIDPTSGYGAKQALEDYRRGQVDRIVELVSFLKPQLNPKQAQSLDQLLKDYVPAKSGITAAKRKVSAKVTTDQFDAVKRLVAGNPEGDTLLQELQKSNIVTDLFKDGMKGGISKWTDLFNPLMTGGQSYDPTRVGNVVVGGLPLLSSNGASLVPQAAIVLGGQAIDKVLGGKGGTRRKLVERFVKLNEGNDGLGTPTGPSLIAQAQQAERQEEIDAQEAAAQKQENTDAFNQMDGIEFNKSPLGTLYLGTGLNQAGLEALLAHIDQHYSDKPAVSRWTDATRRNLAGEENQIKDINKWIGALNGVLNTDARLDALREDQPDNPLAQRARKRAGFGPSASQSSAGTAQQQPQGRSPAVQSGMDANYALADRLLNGMESDQSIPETQKELLRTALLEFGAANSGGNIGGNGQPLQNALAIVERLRASGVVPRFINDYIMPYVQRVAQQEPGRQARRQQQQQQQQPPTSTGGTDLAFDEDFGPRSPDIIDNKNGLGQVPDNVDVAYKGTRVLMKPSTFAKLASSRNGEPAIQFVKEHLQQGGKIGAPFLQVDLDDAKSPKVTSHEGRSRMLGVLETYGDVPIEVHLFPLGKRARHLSPTIMTSLQNDLVGQDGNTVQGPLFSPAPTGNTDLAFDEDFETPRSPSMAQVMHEEMYQSSPKMRARRARELGLDINQKQIRELLKKRGKRKGQDFDYVDPLIEARDTRKSRTPTEIEKLQARQAEIKASIKAMWQKNADEKAARKATRDNLLAAARQARKLGRKVRSSSGRDGKISSYYVSALTGPDLRISDHAIPANPRREFMAQENGRSYYNGYYGPELIIDDTTTDAEVLAFLNGTDLALDQDLAQQGNTGVLATPPAQQPPQQSPFNMKSLVNKMLGSQPATPEQVKAQLPEVRALFEIGKKGSKYENGIQDIDTALALAKALNITVKMFDDQAKMLEESGAVGQKMVRGSFKRGAENQEGTVFGLKAGATSEKLGRVTDLQSLTTLLHEIGHGIAMGPSGFGFTNEVNARDYNDITGDFTTYNASSFESALMPHLGVEGAKNKDAIVKELINLQDNVDVYLENNPSGTRAVRKLSAAIKDLKDKKSVIRAHGASDSDIYTMFDAQEKQLSRHQRYIRGLREISVDPVWVYLANPKLAKKVMPLTAKVLQEQFRNAQNPRIQFFSYPFATMVAVVLAMMLNGRAEEEQEEEQMRQQMPAGALSPQAGALSQQQQFAA